jgi:glycosyltransferase involved in cell wall biosynthesis
LYYWSLSEFCAAMDYLLSHPEERRALGAQGLAFVDREYRWPTVLARVEQLLATTLSARATVEASQVP